MSIQDLTTVIEENSALIDKKTLLEVYRIATEEPYSFPVANLKEKELKDMFMVRFDRRFRFG